MEQPVEFLEQLVGTTGRFVPAGCSDQLFRPVVPKNKKFFDGTSGRTIGTSETTEIRTTGLNFVAQISENGNGDISEIETITETIE